MEDDHLTGGTDAVSAVGRTVIVKHDLGELLLRLRADGRTLVIATHDEEFARAWATRILALRDGVIHQGEAPSRLPKNSPH